MKADLTDTFIVEVLQNDAEGFDYSKIKRTGLSYYEAAFDDFGYHPAGGLFLLQGNLL